MYIVGTVQYGLPDFVRFPIPISCFTSFCYVKIELRPVKIIHVPNDVPLLYTLSITI